MLSKYIFICGGVMSGIGKGITTASIGRILQSRGFKVTAVKIDPYINVDAGTMNPTEHGEVFVTEEGLECDQDIGNYERFLDQNIPNVNYMTTGSVYKSVIERERNLEYGGKCVEVVPHIPEEVIRRIKIAAKKANADFTLVEIGGTVGEYQNALFLEAGRMLKLKQPQDVVFVLVSYLPVPKMIGEMKTKPTQYAVRSLNYAGIQPDIVIGRSITSLDTPRKRKISTFCNLSEEDVISAPDTKLIYEIPLNFEKDNLSGRILKKFNISAPKEDLHEWKNFIRRVKNLSNSVRIGIVGKYFGIGDFTLPDSYISVIEAIKHASWKCDKLPDIHWLDAEYFEKNPRRISQLKQFDGIIVPGGFGSRGVEGKIKVIKYCRENKIPFLGLCYGLQLAVVEFARSVCKLKDANTTEIDPNTKHPVIDTMPEQKIYIKERKMGGSMRLGAYECCLKRGTIGYRAYRKEKVNERHRHRYEVNNAYCQLLEKKGIIFAGVNKERGLVEMIEIKDHPFFVGTQFHPEFKSRPLAPHPLFVEFVRASSIGKN